MCLGDCLGFCGRQARQGVLSVNEVEVHVSVTAVLLRGCSFIEILRLRLPSHGSVCVL